MTGLAVVGGEATTGGPPVRTSGGGRTLRSVLSVGVLGTVQVILAAPENQPHRGELAKLLVHRRARRRGVAESLMRAAEAAALDAGKTLLVLDTANGAAERLYVRLGWQRVGVIPGYALGPSGGLVDTTVFYKELAPGS